MSAFSGRSCRASQGFVLTRRRGPVMRKVDISGLEELRILLGAHLQPMGIAQALKIDLVEVEEGRAVFAGTPGAHVCKPRGIVHGGYAATLLESAIGCAVHSRLNG